jgi:hypothetical protein
MQSIVVETITPEAAKAILANNTHNRALRRAVVARYESDIRAGRWQFNGDTIRVACDGTLLDGQHRLHAVVKAETPITTIVVRGLPRETFKTLDTGVKRTGAQTFTLAGVKNAAAAASMARWVRGITAGDGKNPARVSPTELLEVVAAHPLINHYAKVGEKFRAMSQSACVSVLVLAAEKHGTELIDAFMQRVVDGESLKKGDPEYQLRERFLNNRAKIARLGEIVLVALTIKAVCAFIEGRTVGLLRWSPNEEFPQL